MNQKRLRQQVAFLKEIDKTKAIMRHTRLLDNSRYENDAEHAWHLAVMAMTLAEHANGQQIDIARVIGMVLIHDLVEIDVGDCLVYDSSRREEQEAKESQAATRIFGLLPEDQRRMFRSLWDEFVTRETPEAMFAAALDRLEPIIQNASTHGHAWRTHGISRRQAEAANEHISHGSRELWQYARELFAEAERNGCFPEEEHTNHAGAVDA